MTKQTFTTALWRREWSVCHGWRWVKQRDCARESAEDWLSCYAEDDPSGEYAISDKPPK